jgi:hypothetical protein
MNNDNDPFADLDGIELDPAFEAEKTAIYEKHKKALQKLNEKTRAQVKMSGARGSFFF